MHRSIIIIKSIAYAIVQNDFADVDPRGSFARPYQS